MDAPLSGYCARRARDQREWLDFAGALRQRLDEGARAYGDTNFDRPCEEVLGELEQELLDICGWSFECVRPCMAVWPWKALTQRQHS